MIQIQGAMAIIKGIMSTILSTDECSNDASAASASSVSVSPGCLGGSLQCQCIDIFQVLKQVKVDLLVTERDQMINDLEILLKHMISHGNGSIPEEVFDQMGYPIDQDGHGNQHELTAPRPTQTHQLRSMILNNEVNLQVFRSKNVNQAALAREAATQKIAVEQRWRLEMHKKNKAAEQKIHLNVVGPRVGWGPHLTLNTFLPDDFTRALRLRALNSEPSYQFVDPKPSAILIVSKILRGR
jgi:hypothetical protein